MDLWSRLRQAEDRVLRRRPTTRCHWCEQQNHLACTGVAIRPRFETSAISNKRGFGTSSPCSCFASQHSSRP